MIVSAAVRVDRMIISLPRPYRHGEILHDMNAWFPGEVHMNADQGFLTDKGDFLDRRNALIHARECGQGTPRRDALKKQGKIIYEGDELFSEDIW